MQRTVRCIDIETILLSLWKANVVTDPTGRFLTEPDEGYDHLCSPFIPAARSALLFIKQRRTRELHS
jgi:hypothetical protein